MTLLSLALGLYFALIGSYLYFNAVITDSEGEEIKLSEAVRHFLTSPIWTDLKVGYDDDQDFETLNSNVLYMWLFLLCARRVWKPRGTKQNIKVFGQRGRNWWILRILEAK